MAGWYYFYLYRDGSGNEHGLIASLADLSPCVWSSTATLTTAVSSWDGLGNSNIIQSISPASNTCRTYTGCGFIDWYLPAMDELNLLFNQAIIINKTLGGAGLLHDNLSYWTSTDATAASAVMRGFGKLSQNQGSYPKTTTLNVRAVRSF